MDRQPPRRPHGDRQTDMRPEYDFTGGVRGKHLAQYADSSNVVVLDPDVAKAFPNAAAVNRALRELMTIAQRSRRTRSGARP